MSKPTIVMRLITTLILLLPSLIISLILTIPMLLVVLLMLPLIVLSVTIYCAKAVSELCKNLFYPLNTVFFTLMLLLPLTAVTLFVIAVATVLVIPCLTVTLANCLAKHFTNKEAPAIYDFLSSHFIMLKRLGHQSRKGKEAEVIEDEEVEQKPVKPPFEVVTNQSTIQAPNEPLSISITA